MTDKQLDKLIRRKANVAALNQDIATQLGPLLEARYGVEPGTVDCDAVIDAIDYGAVRGCSLAYVDKHMTICGHPPRVANSVSGTNGK
jgi:hypothetical protein